MIKLMAYPITVLYFICFGLTIIIFHPIQWFCKNVFGYQAHKMSVDLLQFFIMRSLNVLGTTFSFTNPYQIEKGKPLIIVANHQSMYDIPPLIWYLRKHHVKFISKKELGRGIPSVSYNLRHGGSVLIDRKDPIGSIKAIENFAKRISQNNWAAVIFPEGTRSRDGNPKPFKTKGLLAMINHTPDALIVPITINNSWKTLRYGKFPMGLGSKITFSVHKPMSINQHEDKLELIRLVEAQVKSSIV
ncbi:MAG: 1-acyl-sn-glycerol-3-phosphate acyltransferase [Winogradskyella sp.]|uniref:lysophospholipid acyltransferase family protein n=1 Tax=Winogradskyella sp. TaxID=1883156 RepID=UPI0025F3FAC6|nr:lysophospholipid acyltransferase family protein [Winogradskyella sp.]NRB82986.1 1-acyl-sn-glycerol-3-phosphate acyltransferase [Winogradskyella sp.]